MKMQAFSQHSPWRLLIGNLLSIHLVKKREARFRGLDNVKPRAIHAGVLVH